MMRGMTKRPELRPLLLLFAMSSLVITDSLHNNSDHMSQNTTASNTARTGLGLTTAHQTLEMTTSERSKRNQTLGDSGPNVGTEKNVAPQDAGTESPAGINSSFSIVRNGSDPTSLPGSSTITSLAADAEHREVTNKQTKNSSAAVEVTTPRATTWTSTEKRTTVKPTPPKVLSTKSQSKTTSITTTSTVHICPSEAPKREGLVGRCFIAIALLAALATTFIMTTIILATKLAGNRYRHKERLLQETEMVCISALMNDTEHPVPMPRHPKSNGALIPNTEDEDGDNLTLNSFLPETECGA